MAEGQKKKERVGLLHQQQGVILAAAVEDDLGDEDDCEAGKAIADSCQALTDIAQMVKCLLSCLIKRLPSIKRWLISLFYQVCGPSNPAPAQPPSRHSPPTSRPPRSNSPKPPLDGLGGLQEAWASPKHWDEFVLWLKSQSEGNDFDGVPKLLSRFETKPHIKGPGLGKYSFTNFCFRYATWLELYARLDAEERAGAGRERLAVLTKGMMEHEEQFLDKYRCLSCWDGGMRDAANDRAEAGQVGLDFM